MMELEPWNKDSWEVYMRFISFIPLATWIYDLFPFIKEGKESCVIVDIGNLGTVAASALFAGTATMLREKCPDAQVIFVCEEGCFADNDVYLAMVHPTAQKVTYPPEKREEIIQELLKQYGREPYGV